MVYLPTFKASIYVFFFGREIYHINKHLSDRFFCLLIYISYHKNYAKCVGIDKKSPIGFAWGIVLGLDWKWRAHVCWVSIHFQFLRVWTDTFWKHLIMATLKIVKLTSLLQGCTLSAKEKSNIYLTFHSCVLAVRPHFFGVRIQSNRIDINQICIKYAPCIPTI